MGKATIISHAGKGQYTVDVAIETQYVQQQIDKLQEEFTRLHYVDFPAAEAEKISEELKLASAQHDVDIAISNYYADPTDANYAEIQRLTEVALNQSQSFRIAKGNYEAILTRIDALRLRLETLRSNNQKYKRSALWCIDLADGKKDRKLFAPGDEVGTAEISGDIDTGQNLLASYSPGWEYDIQRDGMLVNTNALTPFEFLYDNTLLPPWQKWDHRYRSATITDGNPTDGWTILLDDIKSAEQAIEVNTVNETRTLTGIHAIYMSCDDLAFGIKDHVVVDLIVSGPGNATVLAATIIGFVEKPKPCIKSGFGYYALHTSGTPSEWQHINDETGVWVKQPSYANDLTAHAMDGGGEPTIRSWIGDDEDSEAPVLEFLTPSIYLSGKKLADRPSDRSWSIIGAALSPKRKFLWAVFCDGPISNKVSLGRYPLAVDPANKNDGSSETHTVILSGSLSASSSLNGNIVVDDDALLTASLSSVSTLTASLSVTPGWEMEEFDLGANAIVGSIEGQFSFNSSCTRALSMWGFVHGAKRTPQVSPGGGATWSPNLDLYNNTWKEKLEITITAPDASTMVKAGVSLTNHGRQGFLTKYFVDQLSYTYGAPDIEPIQHNIIDGTYTRDYCYPVHSHAESQLTYAGSYQIDSSFFGDEEITINEEGTGTRSEISDCYNDGDGARATQSASGSSTMSVRVSALGATFPIFHFEQDSNGFSSDDGSSSSATWNVVRGDVTAYSVESGLYAYDYVNYDYSSTSTCTPGSPGNSTTHTETVTTEHGQLWCGAPIDTSVGDPVTDIDDTGSTPSSCYSGGDCGFQCFQDVWGENDPVPPLQDPESPFGAGQPFSKIIDTYFFDITAWNGDDSFFAFLVPSQPYEKVQGARAAGRKHMAYWQNTRTPGSVREYKAYVTGGDPFALDDLTGDVIYRAIHPL